MRGRENNMQGTSIKKKCGAYLKRKKDGRKTASLVHLLFVPYDFARCNQIQVMHLIAESADHVRCCWMVCF